MSNLSASANNPNMTFARKAQYERYFREWDIRKNRAEDDYKVLGQKIEMRRKRGRESDVYRDGELMPRKRLQKEISRQGQMTFTEQFNHAQREYTPASDSIRGSLMVLRNTSPNATWVPDTYALQ